MGDITSKYQGNVSDEGQQNWRGDQISAPQGGQSVFDSASVQLADLGSRKVVGDRVFRYAKAKTDLTAGMTCEYGGETLVSIALGSAITQPAGMRSFVVTAATAISANTYAEGYLTCVAGATDSNLGMLYKIKSNALGSSAGTCKLTLYDAMKFAVKLTSTYRFAQNPYIVASASANGAVMGVAPITVTSGEYFWLQTWGPCAVNGSAAAGSGMISKVSGVSTVVLSASAQAVYGYPLVANTGNNDLCWITVAP